MSTSPKTTTPTHLKETTPFPNALLDDIMPDLKDTEWRLLCVIVRQTLGWKQREGTQGSRRKEFDWLTHRQLQARTGRASEALCKALDALVRKGLVEVWDDQGQFLRTPQARRRYAGRLFFRLGPAIRNQHEPKHEPKNEKGFSESEIRKAKTTKETPTKFIPYDREPKIYGSPPEMKISLNIKNSLNTAPLKSPPPQPPNPDVKRFLSTYREIFKQHTAYKEPPVIDWGKDGKLVKQLLQLYSYERLVDLLEQFFRSEDQWIRKTGYSLAAFKAAIGQLLVNEQRSSPSYSKPVTIRTGQWSKAGATLPHKVTPQEEEL